MGAEIANFTGWDLGTQLATLCLLPQVFAHLDGATYDLRSLRGQ